MRIHRHRATGGFTLIELVVAVAIVAILMVIAMPSYTTHVARSRRAEARAVLFEVAQYLERLYSAKDSYENASLPDRLSTVPSGRTADSANYLVSLTATADTYTITAAPLKVDPCGSLTLTQTGERGSTGKDLTVDECWR